MAGVTPDPKVIESMESQPEFKTPIWDYMAGLVDEQRIADGRAKLAEWSAVLAEAERKFGVDRHVIVAVWGVESDYGKILGGRPLVRSLATASCSGARQRFFRNELVATLRILQSGDMPASALTGSWAGAFGHTKFMPSTFQRLAVDFDGDGRRDIVGSVPDALGSAANFLLRAGWASGQPWGYEVRLPAGYKGPSGRQNRRALAEWSGLGVRTIDGQPLAGSGPAALVLPAEASGPAFIVFRNFDAIYTYNNAVSYALAIAHLSDRLRGGGPFRAAWPTDDPGISRVQRREVQELLIKRGYDIGTADGDRNSMRAKLGFDNESIVIGFSGRLDPIKNFDLMINIFCSCAREDARLNLLIVGDGPERPRVEKMCCDAGVQDRVVFSGQQERVLSYLRAMDMFLLTSIREQMPMTVLEAMAVGVPVLATTVGEIPDIVDHGKNGFVLHSKAPIEEFMTSLNMLVCAKRRTVMGNAARRKIVTSFQQKDMIRKYSSIIEG
jgi:lytic murein transglycosylase